MSEIAVYCLWDGGEIAKDTAVLTELRDEGSDPEKREACVGSPLHWETPLTCSSQLSRKLGAKVWLKLDNLQPPQSYKIRGIGHLCQRVRGGIHVQSKDLVLVLQLLICCESDLRVSSLSSSSRLLKAALTSTALLVAMLDLLQHTVPVS